MKILCRLCLDFNWEFPIYLFINGFQMYVVRNDLSMFATIRSNIEAATQKIRRFKYKEYAPTVEEEMKKK